MTTTVSELPDSRVRVEVEVPAPEVEARIKQAAEQLGKEMKISGFREGKVPPEIVIQRLGRERVLSEALESSLADWYERAMLDAGVNPVGDPKLDLTELPGEGEPLRFAIEVAVRPQAEISDYKGLEVRRGPSPRCPPTPSTPSSRCCARASPSSTRSIVRPRRATCC